MRPLPSYFFFSFHEFWFAHRTVCSSIMYSSIAYIVILNPINDSFHAPAAIDKALTNKIAIMRVSFVTNAFKLMVVRNTIGKLVFKSFMHLEAAEIISIFQVMSVIAVSTWFGQ